MALRSFPPVPQYEAHVPSWIGYATLGAVAAIGGGVFAIVLACAGLLP
jgi:hypothetical protein